MSNLLVYGLLALAVIASAAGLYEKIHGDGVKQGEETIQGRWNTANKKAADLEAQRQAAAKLTADTAAAELAAAQQKATTFEAKWKAERAKHSDTTLAGCQGPTTTLSGASGGMAHSPAPVRFSAGFLRLWDGAWTGQDGQPVFGNQPAAAGQPADTPDALTGIGPGEVLDNFQANAEACSVDRRKLDSLIGQIEKLRSGWH